MSFFHRPQRLREEHQECSACHEPVMHLPHYSCVHCAKDAAPAQLVLCVECERSASLFHDWRHTFMLSRVDTRAGNEQGSDFFDTRRKRVKSSLAKVDANAVGTILEKFHPCSCIKCGQVVIGIRWQSVDDASLNMCVHCFEDVKDIFPDMHYWLKIRSLFELAAQPFPAESELSEKVRSKFAEEPAEPAPAEQSAPGLLNAAQFYSANDSSAYSSYGDPVVTPPTISASTAYSDYNFDDNNGADSQNQGTQSAYSELPEGGSAYSDLPDPDEGDSSSVYSNNTAYSDVAEEIQALNLANKSGAYSAYAEVEGDDDLADAGSSYSDAAEAYSDAASQTVSAYSDAASDAYSGGAYSDAAADASTSAYSDLAESTESAPAPSGYTENNGAAPSAYSDNSATSGYSDNSGGYTDNSEGGGYTDNSATASGYSNNQASGYTYSENGNANASGGYSYNSGASAVAAPAKAAAAARPAAPQGRDWNEDFQRVVAEYKNAGDVKSKFLAARALDSLSQEFVQTATRIGRIIIDERDAPVAMKRVKPQSVGGIAGGEKYIEEGIFFKFAIDAFGVYGGDEFAAKAAAHELNGLKAYFKCHIAGLHFPFMVLMDYRGFRLIATTRLPLSKTSLVYGSADGGVTIKKQNPALNDLMSKAAKIINIKEHVVGIRNQQEVLAAPTDIEGHEGGDGRFYVLDTARVCPPEPGQKSFVAVVFPADLESKVVADRQGRRLELEHRSPGAWTPLPSPFDLELTADRWSQQVEGFLKSQSVSGTVTGEAFMEGDLYHLTPDQRPADPRQANINSRASTLIGKVIFGPAVLVLKGRKGTQLFNLLRYPLIRKSPVPLSSDAFTPFGKHDSQTHNQEVENAFYNLMGRDIRAFVEELEGTRSAPNRRELIKQIQDCGINIRLLGFLRSHIAAHLTDIRSMLLVEMIARVTKNYLRARLRTANQAAGDKLENIIVTHFNILLGESSASSFFWRAFVKMQLASKFGKYGQALTPEEMSTQYDLRRQVSKLVLFQYLSEQIGVEFKAEVQLRFQRRPELFNVGAPLHPNDVDKLVMRVRHSMAPDLTIETLQLARSVFDFEGFTVDKLPEFLQEHLPSNQIELAGAFLNRAHSALLEPLHDPEAILQDVKRALDVYAPTPFRCPMEVTVKAYYIRGCIHFELKQYDSAESHLRAAYYGLVLLNSIGGRLNADPAVVETDRPFSLLVLEKLVELAMLQRRSAEASVFATKFCLMWMRMRFPGDNRHTKMFFGRAVPYALASASSSLLYDHSSDPRLILSRLETKRAELSDFARHLPSIRDIEDSLFDIKQTVNESEIMAWISTVKADVPQSFDSLYLAPQALEAFVLAKRHLSFVYNTAGRYDPPVMGALKPSYNFNFGCYVVATPALRRSGDTSPLKAVFNFRDSDFTSAVVFLVPWNRNASKLDISEALSDPVPVTTLPVFSCDIPVPVDLPVGTYCLGVCTGSSYFTVSNAITIIPNDVKKGLITVDTISQSLQYHPEFENVPPVDISGSPLPIPNAWSYDKCGDSIIAADDLGKTVEIAGLILSNRPPTSEHTKDVFKNPPTWKQLTKLAAFKVVQVACGYNHTLVKTDTGDVLSWGQNKWGQLGHGDTVDRDAPRLVNRLRGKPITTLTAGIGRSLALDHDGKCYAWGVGKSLFPEVLSAFWNDEKKEYVRIIQVACQLTLPVMVDSHNRSRAALWEEWLPVAYLSDTGRVYIQGAEKGSNIMSSHASIASAIMADSEPELLSASVPIFVRSMAMTSTALAFISDENDVYTCGRNEIGELGIGCRYTGKSDVYSTSKLRENLPSTLFKVDFAEQYLKFAQLAATQFQFFALSKSGSVYSWGLNSLIPAKMLDLDDFTVARIAAMSSQVAITLGPAPLMLERDDSAEIEERMHRRAEEANKQWDPREYGIRVNTRGPSGSFVVSWHRSEKFQRRNDAIRICAPGTFGPIPGAPEVVDRFYGLVSGDSQGEMTFSLDENQWGDINNSVFHPKPGTYEFVYTVEENGERIEVARTPPVELVRDMSKITLHLPDRPVLPQTQPEIKWTIPYKFDDGFLVIRKLPEQQIYGLCQLTEAGEPDTTINLVFEGDYSVVMGRSMDSNQNLFEIFHEGKIVVSQPKLTLDDIQLKVSDGPYVVKKPISLSWNVKPEARALWKGSEYFAFYDPEDTSAYPMPKGGVVMMQYAEHETQITPPEKPGKWALRLIAVVMGIVKLYDRIIEVELPEPVAPPPQPAVVPVAAATPAGLPVIIVPTYASWTEFFEAAGIPDMFCGIYNTVMSAQNVNVALIKSLEPALLEKMGIATPAHILAIMDKVREIRTAETKQFIAQYLQALVSQSPVQQPLGEIIDKLAKN